MRQFKFTEQVHKLGWTSPTFQGSHPDFIVDSIHEYHLFLDMSKPSMRPLVPTLSIDLSWHTHMLSGEKYHQDCLRYLDRFLDHDDRVEEGILGELDDPRLRKYTLTHSHLLESFVLQRDAANVGDALQDYIWPAPYVLTNDGVSCIANIEYASTPGTLPTQQIELDCQC